MRLRWGPVPADPTFEPEAEGWRPLREPRSPLRMQLLAVPLGVAAAAALLTAAAGILPGRTASASFDLAALLGLLALVPLHELLHAACFPAPRRAVLGFWPRALACYAHYNGEISRRRFLLVLLCPLLLVSAATLALAAADPARAARWLGLGAAHAVISGGDVLGVLLVVLQVPRGARLRNHGWLSYWRAASPPR